MERYGGEPFPEGDILDTEGRVIGRHRGAVRYTLGQRKGLGVSALSRLYVCGKSMEENTVTLGPESALFSREALVRDVNWISGRAPEGSIRCEAKARYRQQAMPATAEPLEDGSVLLTFDEPVRAITPGQAAVFYRGEEVLGGGVIQRK